MYLVKLPYIFKKLYPKALWRIAPNEKKLFLTFDDGPIKELTIWVLEVLREKNVKATFFCVGENVKKNPEIFQQILNDGHRVGNHTYNHLDGWESHTPTYLKNVLLCENVIQQKEQPIFRPPYGKIKKTQYKLLSNKYKVVMWDVLSGDFDKKTSKEKCLANVTDNVRNGSIIVFHDNIKAEENLRYALPLFIDWAFSQGYTFDII